MQHSQQYQGAKKALMLNLLAAGLLSLANTAMAAPCVQQVWTEGSSYSTGNVVAYLGHNYSALTAHTAYVGANWNPAATPTLWKDLGVCDTGTSNPTPTPIVTTTPTASPTATPKPTPTVTPTATPTATPVSTSSGNTWNASTAYTAGQTVVYNGRRYEAKWWVQGQAPNSSDQWGPWKDLGPAVNQPPVVSISSPTEGQVFNTGDVYQNVTLRANATDSDGQITKVEFIVDGKSAGIATSAPFQVSAAVSPGNSHQLVVIATDNAGATTTTPVRNFSYAFGFPTPSPSPNVTASPSPTPTPSITPYPTDGGMAVFSAVQTTNWKNGATGAYSLVHDDYCSMYFGTDPYIQLIDPELSKRGLVAGFGIITSKCAPEQWAAAKQFIAHGHEIVSHSRSHPDPIIVDANLDAELNGSAADIAANLNGYKASYFIWPSDAASNVGTAFLKNNTAYIGGRASHLIVDGTSSASTVDYTTMPAGVNDANFTNPYRVLWDLYTVDGQWSLYPMGSDILNLHIDAAINGGGWATRTMHSVDTGYWQTAPLAVYQAHLDYAKAKVDAGALWMDTPSNVIKYRYAREFCKPILSTSSYPTVTFDTSSAECQKYATPITLQISAVLPGNGSELVLRQNGKFTTAKAGPNHTFLATVDPLAGPVTFSYPMP